jgi:hypothetical protein
MLYQKPRKSFGIHSLRDFVIHMIHVFLNTNSTVFNSAPGTVHILLLKTADAA